MSATTLSQTDRQLARTTDSEGLRWCNCPDYDIETSAIEYYEDRERTDPIKRHFRHADCDGIVQIG